MQGQQLDGGGPTARRPSGAHHWPVQFLRHPPADSTAQRSGEPAWHRRQRRARAYARVLVRLSSARSLLSGHHSAQRAGPSMAKHEPKHLSRLVQGAPRFPLWTCAGCGATDNWGDRDGCRRCHAAPPASVTRRQREAVSGRKPGGGGGGGGGKNGNGGRTSSSTPSPSTRSSSAAGKGGGGGSTGSGGGGGGGGGPGGKGQPSALAPAAARSYVDAVVGGARAGTGAAVATATELAELRRSNERLVRQVTELRAAQSEHHTATGEEIEDADEDDDTAAARDEKIRVLQSNIKSIALVFGEESTEHVSKKAELEAMLKAKRECKPLKVQLQNADKRIERLRNRAQRADAAVGQICTKIADLRDELEGAEHELDEAKTLLAQAEEERKALLLREAQSAKAEAGGDGVVAKASNGEEEWSRMVNIIQDRATQPGVQAELATQIGSALQMLHALCRQLPSPPESHGAQAAASHGKAASAGGPSTPPQADGGAGDADAEAARALARQMAETIRHDMAISASVRRGSPAQPSSPAAPAAPAAAPAAPVAPAPWPLPPAQPAVAPSPTPPPSADTGGANAPAGGSTTDIGADGTVDKNQDVILHDAAADSDGLTEDEDSGIRFFEEALAATPEAQKEKLQQILEKRKQRLEQRRGDPKRHKRGGKPDRGGESARK